MSDALKYCNLCERPKPLSAFWTQPVRLVDGSIARYARSRCKVCQRYQNRVNERRRMKRRGAAYRQRRRELKARYYRTRYQTDPAFRSACLERVTAWKQRSKAA